MNWLKYIFAFIKYKKRIMTHIITIQNLKVQIEAERKAILETIELIKEE